MIRQPFYLGEGERDVGSPEQGRIEADFEGDIPRLMRRIVRELGGPESFAYVAETIRGIVETIPRQGTPTRIGGKSKDLRDAVLAVLQDSDVLFLVAVIDARQDELEDLEPDVRTILRLCEERAPDVPVAIGLAIQEIEIWMIADPYARMAAFGEHARDLTLWTHLEEVDDPKSLWAEFAGRSPAPDAKDHDEHADDQRASAWHAMRPNEVARGCPRGFAPFLEAAGTVVKLAFRRTSKKRR